MTPTETATILRQFNEWRRGDEDIPQFDPREIGEAIDAAIAMIDRIEAAEKDIALKERIIDSIGSILTKVVNERDALRARIEEMEQQKPAAWMLNCQTLGGDTGWMLSWTQSGAGMCNRLSGEENERKLYALPGAKGE